jgi:flagellar biosynthesis component FlhA
MSTERQLPEVGEEIHLPGPSAQPLLVAVTTTILLIGLTQPSPVMFLFGLATLLIVLYAWIRDARAEFKALPEHHGHGDDHGHGEPHADEHAAPSAH